MSGIRRREFITLLGGAAVWPLATHAQPSGKVYRMGFLGVTSHDAEYRLRVDALRTGLHQLGYEEGKNIIIHYRWAEGRYDRLPVLAAELVQLNVNVIVTAGRTSGPASHLDHSDCDDRGGRSGCRWPRV